MMRKLAVISVLALLLGGALVAIHFNGGEFEGVDKTVVEAAAAKAGHPATRPFIDTEKGDLLLMLFLAAGAVSGFVGGYVFRGLFPPARDGKP